MKVSGFSIVRNAIRFDFPIVEAIQSVLPLVDEFVLAVGKSEDDTLGLIQRLQNPKIKIIETVWDESLREGGKVLASETNKALAAISPDTDWAIYIQGDEVLHEEGYKTIRNSLEQNVDNPEVEGFVLKYRHFWGSYEYVGDSRQWYRREVRIVRNTGKVYSYKDAQGFRTGTDQKLHVKEIDAWIHHYGWVKRPEFQVEKRKNFSRYWNSDSWMQRNRERVNQFSYDEATGLKKFEGTHPAVMQDRVSKMDWNFTPSGRSNLPFQDRLYGFLAEKFDWYPFEYQNFRLRH